MHSPAGCPSAQGRLANLKNKNTKYKQHHRPSHRRHKPQKMPSQAHKWGSCVTVQVRADGVAPEALAHCLQAWMIASLAPARYLVCCWMASGGDDGDGTMDTTATTTGTACVVAGAKKRADNVRASLRAVLTRLCSNSKPGADAGAGTEAAVSAHVVSVLVTDGCNDVHRAAQVRQGAPAGAVVRLQGWDEEELRAAAAGEEPERRPSMRWVTRARGLHTLSTYVTPKTVFGRGERKAPHGDPAFTLCPPGAACEACRAFSDAVSDGVRVDVRAALQAALRDGWDVSLLYDSAVMAQLQGALEDMFRNTYLSPQEQEQETESKAKRRRVRDDDF